MIDQERMPIVEMLIAYEKENGTPFHMPGHKGGRGFTGLWEDTHLKWDITEFPGSDNLHDPDGVIWEAQNLAAEAFGARDTFFLVNGASIGIAAMLLATVEPGQRAIVSRNCHACVLSALALGGIDPIFVMPELEQEHLLMTCTAVEKITQVMDENPRAVCVLVPYPNYYGMGFDLKRLAKEVHGRGKLLLVDEAHGAHFPFHDNLPPSSSVCDVDLWVQSAHKTLPALTQSAYLHVGTTRVMAARIHRVLQTLHTTSPSYLLLMSLDWARHFMVTTGQQKLEVLLDRVGRLRRDINEIEGLHCFGNEWLGKGGVTCLDDTRLVVDVKGIGISGYEAEEFLRKEHAIQIEMSDWYHIVMILTVADDSQTLGKLKNALQELSLQKKRWHQSHSFVMEFHLPPLQIIRKISPRQALYSIIEEIPLKVATGRIASNSIGIYPPGIPLFCPGEEITHEGIIYLLEMQQLGCRIFGWLDSRAQTIGVVGACL